MSLRTTASQTVGPYLHIGMTWLVTDNLVGAGVAGDPMTLSGRVTDADGEPVDDAVIEIWQANAHGRYPHPDDTRDLPLEAAFTGFGRIATDASGTFRFRTIKPGPVPSGMSAAGPSKPAQPYSASMGSAAATAASVGAVMQAPHLNVTIFMRGMLKQLRTRVYFPGDPANANDPVLRQVPEERRATLIARSTGGNTLEWNVVLQGEGETVFFDY